MAKTELNFIITRLSILILFNFCTKKNNISGMQPNGNLSVFIRGIDDKMVHINNLDENNTLNDLKKRFLEKVSITYKKIIYRDFSILVYNFQKPEDITLYLNKFKLPKNKKLKDYNICNLSILEHKYDSRKKLIKNVVENNKTIYSLNPIYALDIYNK